MINTLTNFAQAITHCDPSGGDLFGFPKWYKYLQGNSVLVDPTDPSKGQVCTPHIGALSDVWLVVAAVIEMLLRVAVLAAIGFVLYGGVRFITSHGEPDQTNRARSVIVNALIGMVLAIAAAGIVSFVAGRF